MTSENSIISKPEKTALVAIAVNVALTAIKFVLAALTSSLALLAEAFHSFADIGSSFAVYMALKTERTGSENPNSFLTRILRKNPQRKVAIFIGAFLLFIAISVFIKAFQPKAMAVNYPVPAALTMIVLALMSFLLSRFEITVGERNKSMALIADGIHSRVDMFGSLLVAIALLGESLSLRLDRLAAGIISFFILLQAVNVFVAVARDYMKHEKRLDYFYPEWLLTLSRESYPQFKQRIYSIVAMRLRIPPSAPDVNRRVGRILSFALLLTVIIIYFVTGFFTVDACQAAIVERFGFPLQKERALGPGLHYRLPWPIDKVRKVNSMRVRQMVVGSEIAQDSKVLLWTNIHYVREFNILSGENIFVDVSMILQYNIEDAYQYLYATKNPEGILRELGYSALLKTMAHHTFFDVVTTDRDKVEDIIFRQISAELKHFNVGLKLISVNLRDLHPPTNVASDFEEVISASVDYETYINEARGYYNDLIPRARGQAMVMTQQANAEKKALALHGKGESQLFLKILSEYQKAPRLTRTRFFLETMDSVLAGKEKYILPPEAARGAVDIFHTNNP